MFKGAALSKKPKYGLVQEKCDQLRMQSEKYKSRPQEDARFWKFLGKSMNAFMIIWRKKEEGEAERTRKVTKPAVNKGGPAYLDSRSLYYKW